MMNSIKSKWQYFSAYYNRNIGKRQFLHTKGNKLSFFQIFGLFLIFFGILFPLFEIFISDATFNGNKLALSFFITMMGIAFVFPDLLQSRGKDFSTMRLVVFMLVNVICILLLKLGWEQKSLTDIGLDQYWVGVIAFLFGAKASQSYFESKMAVPSEELKTGTAALTFSNAEIAKLALEQNQSFLKIKFPNIVSLSDAVHDLNHPDSHVIAIYLKDNNTVGMPDQLEVKMPDGSTKNIATEIIKGVGTAKIQFSQAHDFIEDSLQMGYKGSICCAVSDAGNEDFLGIVTAAHIFTHGNYDDRNNGILSPGQQRAQNPVISGKNGGQWYLKAMTQTEDLAVISVDKNQFAPDNLYKSFSASHYTIKDEDIKSDKPNVTIISKDNKIRDAYIIDYGIGLDIDYNNGKSYKKNIILIGNSNDRDLSHTVSDEGDSGSCVYHKDTNQLIGILLGGNYKFSFVLPIEDTLHKFNLKTV